ncbi:MAG: SDR family oxidoreductase [Pseudomonadota bacterium]
MAKRILITGASSGIGASTAEMAVAEGHSVALVARSKDKLDALVSQLGGEKAHAIVADVADWDDAQRMVAEANERLEGIDVVFANAGRGGGPGGYTEGDVEMWRSLIDVNIYGLALTVRASAAALKASKGHLLITSSIAGRRTIQGSVYGMTKWAATAIGYNVREEFKPHDVRVTLIEPGMVDTSFFDEPKPDALKPEDVARSVLFAINQPKHVSLTELVVTPS